jgi:hypothetical protein
MEQKKTNASKLHDIEDKEDKERKTDAFKLHAL